MASRDTPRGVRPVLRGVSPVRDLPTYQLVCYVCSCHFNICTNWHISKKIIGNDTVLGNGSISMQMSIMACWARL